LIKTVTNKSYVHEELKGNACYHAVHSNMLSCVLSKFYCCSVWGDEIKVHTMRTHNMHGEDKKGTAKWYPENPDGTNILEDLDKDRRIILKWNLYIQNVDHTQC
jgi:hypothetical protein